MRLSEVSNEDRIDVIGTMRNSWVPIVREFVESGMDVAEVTDLKVKADYAYRVMKAGTRRHEWPVQVVKRGDRVFLVRDET